MVTCLRRNAPLVMAAVILACLIQASSAQESVGNRFALMSPQELIATFGQAGRLERKAIVEALVDNRNEALPALRAALHSGTPAQAILAARLLGEMRDTSAVDALIDLAQSRHVTVALHAITALRDIGATRAAPALRQILLEDSVKKNVSICVLLALGTLGDDSDLPTIRTFLTAPCPVVVTAAARALAMLGDRGAQDVLIPMTDSPNPAVQALAIEGLGHLNTPEATRRLQDILEDPRATWKADARIALLDQQLRTSLSIPEQIRDLAQFARDENRWIAAWAIRRFADMDTSEARTELFNLARGNSRNARTAAILCKLRGEIPR